MPRIHYPTDLAADRKTADELEARAWDLEQEADDLRKEAELLRGVSDE
jgi:hypothetical protein